MDRDAQIKFIDEAEQRFAAHRARLQSNPLYTESLQRQARQVMERLAAQSAGAGERPNPPELKKRAACC